MSGAGSRDRARAGEARVDGDRYLKMALQRAEEGAHATGRSARRPGKVGTPASRPGPERPGEIQSITGARELPGLGACEVCPTRDCRLWAPPKLSRSFLPGGPEQLVQSLPWRVSPHCSAVNLVRAGRQQPQPFPASAGGRARHPEQRCEGRLLNEAPFVVSGARFSGVRSAVPRFGVVIFRCDFQRCRLVRPRNSTASASRRQLLVRAAGVPGNPRAARPHPQVLSNGM